MKKRYQHIGIAVLMSSAFVLTACQSGTPGTTPGSGQASMEAGKLAEAIRQKYEEKYEYTEPMRGVARDEKLELQMGFDIKGGEFIEYTQIVNVYEDAELTQPVGSHFEWDEEKQILSVTPPRWNAAGISSVGLDSDDPGYSPSASSLFEKGELQDWGNLPQYYMAQYVDSETGEALEKPRVTVFTVDHEIHAAP